MTRPLASLYVRLSKQAGETNLSAAGYMEELRQLADQQGYGVFAEHFDDGVSGAIRDRPEFTGWLDDARSGSVQALITPHADRLTREGVNAAAMVLDVVEGKDPTTGRVVSAPVRLLDQHGTDSDGDQTAFRFQFVIAAEVARAERARIADRNQRTRARLRSSGRWPGGRAPYCTRAVPNPDGPGKVLGPDPDEIERAQEAARRALRGDPLTSVCRFMNGQGWTTNNGKAWNTRNLSRVLLSPYTRDFALTAAEARELAEVLAPTPDPSKRSGKPQVWLLARGLAVCSGCGRGLVTSSSSRKHGSHARYRCRSVALGSCPAPVTIAAAPLDEWITGEFLRRFGDFEHVEPRVIVTGAEDVEAAERAQEAAQAALLADPTPEAVTAYRAAQERLAAAQAEPVTRETQLVATGVTVREFWQSCDDVPTRAGLLWDALGGPVVILPSPKSPGRAPIDFDARARAYWRGDDGEHGDWLAGQDD